MEIFIKGSVPSSKNSKVFTGRFLVWSKAAQKYRKESRQQYLDNRDLFVSHIDTYPIKLYIKFVRGTRHKFDYINPCQTLLDLMVEHGWLPDDNSDIVIPIFEEYSYDKQNPGVCIRME